MKREILVLIFALSIGVAQAQDASDAMRYSLDNTNGTARFSAMGGAFGALGGDFSALNINPAGSAIFSSNQASLTLTSYNIKNKSNYFGATATATDNTFDLNQTGAVWIFDDFKDESNWRKIALAINYENTSNFDNSIYSAGTNPDNSVADYFVDYANGIPLGTITSNSFDNLYFDEQQAYLGYEGYLINPIAGSTNQYVSNLSATQNYYQQNSLSSSGFNGKLSFNAAAAYKDKLYIGLNLNSHFSDYTRTTSFYEDYRNANNHDASTGVQASRFTNYLYTFGTGFSFQLGAIAKVNDALRLGLSYESPTWYRLNDELLQTLAVETTEQGKFYADPDLIIIYPSYRLQTPSKYNGSLAYVFGKQGILSIDYTFKDYTNICLKPNSDYFNSVNNTINTTFDATSELRVGGEYRIKQWSLRGGYRYEQSPYKNNKTIGDLNSYSTGLGYNFGDYKIDLAYTLAKRDYQQATFTRGLIDTANINGRNDNVTLTVLFQL